MAKLKKKSARKGGAGTAKSSTKGDSATQAERVGKSISESAQQIWLAGMGAFTRAQAEGGKLFESLVRDGLSLEQTARKFAGTGAEVVRDAFEGRVGLARERAVDTWDKLEKGFEERVQRALVKLGVPSREDLDALATRVERLNAELRKASGTPSRKAGKTPPAPRKPGTRVASTGSTTRPAAGKPRAKQVRKRAKPPASA